MHAASRVAAIRDKLGEGRPLFMGWSVLGMPFAVELAGASGADLIVIDQQHGIGGNADMLACLTAADAAGIPAMVRVARNEAGLIGRALDAGAQGVICPMVNTAEDAEALVSAVRYPPLGSRSLGPYRAKVVTPDYAAVANGRMIACGQIETRTAIDNLEAILATEGFEMVCAGPNDLAFTLSGGAHADIRASETVEALDLVLAKCQERGVIASIFANDEEYAAQMLAKGWQVVAVGTDAGWLMHGGRAARSVFGTGA